MRAVTEAEIRASFVNASKGDAKRASLPDLDAIDFLLDKLRNTKSNSEFFDSMNA